jgi:hypothetical protein
MRNLRKRLEKLEAAAQATDDMDRLQVHFGYRQELPEHYVGPRHMVEVNRLPSGGQPSRPKTSSAQNRHVVDFVAPPTPHNSHSCRQSWADHCGEAEDPWGIGQRIYRRTTPILRLSV